MMRYRFLINDGSPIVEGVVVDLANAMDARREALRIAAERLFDAAGSLVIPPGWRVDVTDDDGTLLFQIAFPRPGREPAEGAAAEGLT